MNNDKKKILPLVCQAILNAGGDYVLPAKMNQESLFCAIEKLFQDTPDAADTDLRIHPVLGEPYDIHKTVEKAHGRLETRCLKASTSLNEYLDCPGVSQVFQYSYSYKDLNTGEEKHKIHYGITSLSPKKASAERLLSLRRGHWSIENKSHWMRDTLLGEDTSSVRCGAIPQVMAALRNTALSVFRFTGATRIADMMKYYASNPKLAVNIIK